MKSKNNVQIFMLHFAGGNIYSFQFLKPYMPTTFDFYPLELPGRGKRISEKLLSSKQSAIEDFVHQITSLRNTQPYVIFGHSMGASLGLRVTKKLEALGDPPKKLIVAGNAGPGTGEDKYRSKMNDIELKEELKILGGVSDEVLSNDDVFNFYLPILKSDFMVLEDNEEIASDLKIKSSITAVMGDKEKTSEKIENWRNFTSGEFEFCHLPGNHFFIYDHPMEIVRIIKKSYDRPLVF